MHSRLDTVSVSLFALACALPLASAAGENAPGVFARTVPTRLAAVSPPAPDPYRPRPGRGRFLIATRQLTSPVFAQTVLLLIDYGVGGAVGLIINRPTGIPLSELLPDDEALRDREVSVLAGGPVALRDLMLLIRSPQPLEGASRVLDDVHVTKNASVMRQALANEAGADNLRAYAGYAGWAPGQLESEIDRGDWHLAPGDPNLVFSDTPQEIWPGLIRDYDGHQVRPAWPAAAHLAALLRMRAPHTRSSREND